MKLDFTFYAPTKIYFGKMSLDNLALELKQYGDNILLVYGKASVKKIGLYDKVIKILKDAGKNVTELAGVSPNPRYSEVLEGCEKVRNNNIDLILALGGGSVIDCSKAISAGAYCETDPWNKYYRDFKDVTCKVIPIGSILTMAGTGSEMNAGSVITNEATKEKVGRVYPDQLKPKFSILNPEFTYSVPKYQMVSGISDIMSHLMEQYFSGDDDNTTDYVIEGVLRSLIVSARKALQNPEDYEARSNIMWSATIALNDFTGVSKSQDWQVHMLEHQLGAYTDCAHGIGLGIIGVPYYKYIYKLAPKKFARYAKNVWDIDTSKMSDEEASIAGINAYSAFLRELGIPERLRDVGTTKEMLPLIANSVLNMEGGYKKFTKEDNLKVLEAAF